jgi:uncharacterized protein YcaQ
MKLSFTRAQVSGFRLKRHHLAGRNPSDLGAVCQDACGIQAQVMGAAQMALWARTHAVTQAEIDAALWESHALVRASCMRGTLHLLAADDFLVYMRALKSSRVRQMLAIMSRYGVTQEEAFSVREAVMDALGAGPMTRRQLTERILSSAMVGKKTRVWLERSSWGFRHAMAEGFLCFGQNRGQEATMVRVDQWLPEQKAVSEQEAQQVLLRRYLSAYGPATLQDFSKWSGFSAPEAGAVWKLLKDELVEVSLEEKKGWMLREDCAQLRDSHARGEVVRLLPNFDPYLLGHRDTSHVVDSRCYKRVYRNQGWISPVILLNGRVAGVWSHQRRGDRLLLTMEPFENLARNVRAKVEEEAASLGDFLEASAEVRWLGC